MIIQNGNIKIVYLVKYTNKNKVTRRQLLFIDHSHENIAHTIKGVDPWHIISYYLSPIAPFISMPDISEICVDRFDEIFIERKG